MKREFKYACMLGLLFFAWPGLSDDKADTETTTSSDALPPPEVEQNSQQADTSQTANSAAPAPAPSPNPSPVPPGTTSTEPATTSESSGGFVANSAAPAPAIVDGQTQTPTPQIPCSPTCREGFTCINGECVTACNPPCSSGKECTGAGVCVPSKKDEKMPRFSLGMNYGAILEGGMVSAVAPVSAFIPIPLELAIRIHRFVGISATLQYLYHYDGDTMKRHEAMLAFGPRVSFTGRGVKGGFAAVEVGMSISGGTTYDDDSYLATAVVLQPKVGYALHLTRAPLYFSFGMGLLMHFFFHEDPGPLEGDGNLNALGRMANYYTPLFIISFGFSL